MGKPLPDDKQAELDTLRQALSEVESTLTTLPPDQQEWLYMWEVCSSQRLGVGMALGPIIHSEIWNNLREFGVAREDRLKFFRIVNGVDSIFRQLTEKSRDRRGNKPPSIEGVRTLVEQRKGEMERGSKSI